MAEIGENTQVKANIAFMAKVIAIVGSAVWGYSVICNKINTIADCDSKGQLPNNYV